MAKDEDIMDKVLKLDRFQQSDRGIVCPNVPAHGKMGPNSAGTLLVCTLCDPPVPVYNAADILKESA